MAEEIWKIIPGFENYKASNLGQIRKIVHVPKSAFGPAHIVDGPLMKPTLRKKDNYLIVGLISNGKQYQKGLHQFILLAFVGHPPEGQQTLHADGIRTNCLLSNLSYGTALANAADRTKHGNTGIGEKNGNSKLSDGQVLEIRKIKAETNCTYASLAPQFGVTPEMISKICNRDFRTNI